MEYTFKLTQQEIGVLIQALGEIPMKLSLNLFHKIQQGIQEQDATNAVEVEGEFHASP